MSERQRRGIDRAADWAVEKIAERFDQHPFPTHNIVHGEGTLLGAPVDSFDSYLLHQIEFFPDAGVVRVTAPDVRIELFRAAVPQPTEDGVRVENEAGTTRIVFTRASHITVDVFPAHSEFPHSRENAPDEDVSGSSTPIDPGASRARSETAQTGEQKEQPPRDEQ